MSLDRRDLLRLGASGIAGALIGGPALGQQANERPKSAAASTEFGGGTGTLFVRLKLPEAKPAGTLELRLEDFVRGHTYTLIATGTYTPDRGPAIKMYRAYFSAENEQEVYMRLADDDHWTSLAFAPTEDPQIRSLTVWNDKKTPESFRIDKGKFSPTASVTDYVLDNRGASLDLKGNRKPVESKIEPIENAMQNNTEYLAFTRGKNLPYQHARLMGFDCPFAILTVPGGWPYVFRWNDSV